MLLRVFFTLLFLCCCLILGLVVLPSDIHNTSPYYWTVTGTVVISLFVTLTSKTRGLLSWIDIWVLVLFLFVVLRMALDDISVPCRFCSTEMLGVYFCFRKLFEGTYRGQQLLCLLFIGTGLWESLWGLSQLYGIIESNHILFKLTGSFHNPGPFAGYLAMVLPLALHGLLSINITRSVATSFPYIFSAMSVCCILIVLPITMSRSAWLGALVGSTWVLAVHYHWLERLRRCYDGHRRLYFAGLTTLLLLCAIMFAGAYLLKKPSADGRLLIWKITTGIIADHPWFGVGPGHFSGAFGQEQADYFASRQGRENEARDAGVPEYAFNEYLQIGAEWGICGLTIFLLMVSSSFVNIERQKSEALQSSEVLGSKGAPNMNQISVQPGVIGSLLSLLAFSCFSYPLSFIYFRTALAFLLASVASLEQTTRPWTENRRASASGWVQCSAFALMAILLFGVLRICMPIWESDQKWQKMQSHFPRIIKQKEDIEAFEKLYPFEKDNTDFLFQYGKTLIEFGELRAANEIFRRGLTFRGDPMFCNMIGKNYQALRQYDLSEYWLIRSTHMVPNLLYPHYLLAKMYLESGQVEKAKSKACYVIEKKPKVASMATREMKEEMIQMLRTIQDSQSQMDTEFPGTESFSQQESPKP